jgi:hypothetical protein
VVSLLTTVRISGFDDLLPPVAASSRGDAASSA